MHEKTGSFYVWTRDQYGLIGGGRDYPTPQQARSSLRELLDECVDTLDRDGQTGTVEEDDDMEGLFHVVADGTVYLSARVRINYHGSMSFA